MYAVIQTGGKQYRVSEGSTIKVELLKAEQGASVELGKVLMIANGDDVRVGTPYVEGGKVTACRLAYGGMAAIPKRAKAMENKLLGRPLDSGSVSEAIESLSEDFSPLSDWRGSAAYRKKTAAALLHRLARDLAGEIVEVMAL